MALAVEDIRLLRSGMAPAHLELVRDMTLGGGVWLDRFETHYLERFIPFGGSKVKVLVGSEGSGKSHLMRCIQDRALRRDYASLFLSARTVGAKLHDVPNLYRLIVETLDIERLVSGMARTVGSELGYGTTIYDGHGKLLPYITDEGFDTPDAAREIRITMAKLLRQADLGPSFFTFAMTLLRDRLLQTDESGMCRTAVKWFRGEKLEPKERRDAGLFEVLNRTTARRWLDSLLKLIVLSGQKGLVLLIDDLDVLYERSPDTGRFLYTAGNNKDTYELFRQIIDDADLLKNLLVVLAGRRNLMEDERRGFMSYEALWMRLQTGLVPSGRFNPLCDIVDVDRHLEALGPDFPEQLSEHLADVFAKYGIRRIARTTDMFSGEASVLKSAVVENIYSGEEDA